MGIARSGDLLTIIIAAVVVAGLVRSKALRGGIAAIAVAAVGQVLADLLVHINVAQLLFESVRVMANPSVIVGATLGAILGTVALIVGRGH
jgi:hypothetical protein